MLFEYIRGIHSGINNFWELFCQFSYSRVKYNLKEMIWFSLGLIHFTPIPSTFISSRNTWFLFSRHRWFAWKPNLKERGLQKLDLIYELANFFAFRALNKLSMKNWLDLSYCFANFTSAKSGSSLNNKTHPQKRSAISLAVSLSMMAAYVLFWREFILHNKNRSIACVSFDFRPLQYGGPLVQPYKNSVTYRWLQK